MPRLTRPVDALSRWYEEAFEEDAKQKISWMLKKRLVRMEEIRGTGQRMALYSVGKRNGVEQASPTVMPSWMKT